MDEASGERTSQRRSVGEDKRKISECLREKRESYIIIEAKSEIAQTVQRRDVRENVIPAIHQVKMGQIGGQLSEEKMIKST